MPFKVTDFGSNRKLIYDFLLVINTNLPPILHRFQVMAVHTWVVFLRVQGRGAGKAGAIVLIDWDKVPCSDHFSVSVCVRLSAQKNFKNYWTEIDLTVYEYLLR